jgi:hypothetical protein
MTVAINPTTGNPLRKAATRPATSGNFDAARKALSSLAEFDQAQRDAIADEWNLAREEGRYTSTWAYEQTQKVFDLLKDLRAAANEPKARETHTVPTGRYAVGPAEATKFYRVVVSDNFTKVQVQASDDLHDLRWNVALPILRQIEDAGIEAARTRYGVEIGRCWRCGRTLTDPDSRAQGIGPDCAQKV